MAFLAFVLGLAAFIAVLFTRFAKAGRKLTWAVITFLVMPIGLGLYFIPSGEVEIVGDGKEANYQIYSGFGYRPPHYFFLVNREPLKLQFKEKEVESQFGGKIKFVGERLIDFNYLPNLLQVYGDSLWSLHYLLSRVSIVSDSSQSGITPQSVELCPGLQFDFKQIKRK